eukprot:Clim_evm14s8 gene=Clim_evmTU14s8
MMLTFPNASAARITLQSNLSTSDVSQVLATLANKNGINFSSSGNEFELSNAKSVRAPVTGSQARSIPEIDKVLFNINVSLVQENSDAADNPMILSCRLKNVLSLKGKKERRKQIFEALMKQLNTRLREISEQRTMKNSSNGPKGQTFSVSELTQGAADQSMQNRGPNGSSAPQSAPVPVPTTPTLQKSGEEEETMQRRNSRVFHTHITLCLPPKGEDYCLGFEIEDARKLRIASIEPGSIGAKSGAMPGDLMTAVNEVPVKNLDAFQQALRDASDRSSIRIDVRRAMQLRSVMVSHLTESITEDAEDTGGETGNMIEQQMAEQTRSITETESSPPTMRNPAPSNVTSDDTTLKELAGNREATDINGLLVTQSEMGLKIEALNNRWWFGSVRVGEIIMRCDGDIVYTTSQLQQALSRERTSFNSRGSVGSQRSPGPTEHELVIATPLCIVDDAGSVPQSHSSMTSSFKSDPYGTEDVTSFATSGAGSFTAGSAPPPRPPKAPAVYKNLVFGDTGQQSIDHATDRLQDNTILTLIERDMAQMQMQESITQARKAADLEACRRSSPVETPSQTAAPSVTGASSVSGAATDEAAIANLREAIARQQGATTSQPQTPSSTPAPGQCTPNSNLYTNQQAIDGQMPALQTKDQLYQNDEITPESLELGKGPPVVDRETKTLDQRSNRNINLSSTAPPPSMMMTMQQQHQQPPQFQQGPFSTLQPYGQNTSTMRSTAPMQGGTPGNTQSFFVPGGQQTMPPVPNHMHLQQLNMATMAQSPQQSALGFTGNMSPLARPTDQQQGQHQQSMYVTDAAVAPGLQDLQGFAWYFGPISRSQAEGLLHSPLSQDGDFLIRQSENDPNALTMTMRYQGASLHTRINRDETTGQYFLASQRDRLYVQLDKLIEDLQVDGLLLNQGALRIFPRRPCPRVQSSMYIHQ